MIALRKTAHYGSPAARQLSRLIDGAVRNAIQHHADYFTPKGLRCVRGSIVKRVVGQVMGYARESFAAGGAPPVARDRSGFSPAVDMEDGRTYPASEPDVVSLPSWPFVAANHGQGGPVCKPVRLTDQEASR